MFNYKICHYLSFPQLTTKNLNNQGVILDKSSKTLCETWYWEKLYFGTLKLILLKLFF